MKLNNPSKKCDQCGLCCRLFLINLSEEEYFLGRYATMFNNIEKIDNFELASSCGANLLNQNTDGSCIYLKGNECSIHETRPAVCRQFFCRGTEAKYKKMREIINAAR